MDLIQLPLVCTIHIIRLLQSKDLFRLEITCKLFKSLLRCQLGDTYIQNSVRVLWNSLCKEKQNTMKGYEISEIFQFPINFHLIFWLLKIIEYVTRYAY